ncbi:urease accessory protein UreE [Pseudomonas sp.]|jgi:urease accessory protein|uniref:urease accessory protein UreE n=1 Tax=Pseudomonas sp. TaxID=306 RepID=UPI00272C554F|nr:urease accessory protein UreE [Pseudomonas sp.]
MLECHEFLDQPGPAHHELELTYEKRTRSRLRARTLSGVEVGLFLPRGRVLAEGDRLLATDSSVIVIRAAAETLSCVRCEDPLLLARAAYHMGNRHVALEVRRGELRYLRDHVLDAMLRGLSLEVEEIVAPFNPEPGAYHGHSHSVATPPAPMLRLTGHSHG